MSEALLLFSSYSSPAHGSPRSGKVRWHWLLQACALASAYTGLAVISTNKMLNSKQHYTTWHGTMGISVCAVVAIQAAGGISLMWPDILPFQLRRVTHKRLHAVCGAAVYCGALCTMGLGLYSAWFVASVANTAVWGACMGSLAVLAVTTVVQVTGNHFMN